MLQKLKKKIVNWLLRGVEVDELRVIELKVGRRTIVILPDRIRLSGLSEDPSTLSAGDMWLNSSSGKIKFSPDGSAVSELPVSPIGSGDIADGAVTTAKIADGAVTEEKIADGAVTDAKITGPISPGKIGTGDLDLGSGTLTCGQISVGDLIFKNKWRLVEHPEYGLVLVSPEGRKYAFSLREVRD